MKKIVKVSAALVFLALAHLGAAQNQETASSHCPYDLTIKTYKPTVTWGSPIYLRVEIKNATTQKLAFVPYDIKEMGFAVDVFQANGSRATLTEHGKTWPHSAAGWSGSGPFTQLEPGAVFIRRIDVSDLYDMTTPGKYSIQLHCADVSSNTITVEIAP